MPSTAQNPVYLLPGIMCSDLYAANGTKVWWNLRNIYQYLVGALRLAPDGVSPGPPDGIELAAVRNFAQSPWGQYAATLQSQLDVAKWSVRMNSYDWRKPAMLAAIDLANRISEEASPTNPATIVGHSMGGLVAVLTWQTLLRGGQSNLVRRLITVCTPFQGSYFTVAFMGGVDPSVTQMMQAMSIVPPYLGTASKGILQYIANVALTWPGFYSLWPALYGSEAITDPYRALIYNPANFEQGLQVSSGPLAIWALAFQSAINTPDAFPPAWVATYVVSNTFTTYDNLQNPAPPVLPGSLGTTAQGDTIVTTGSMTRSPGLIFRICCEHGSAAFDLIVKGQMAELILDPRGPDSPPPQPQTYTGVMPQIVTAPPESEYVSGLQCLSGG
jgi:pimeloyl-ACP methyl ester carboxylesterase